MVVLLTVSALLFSSPASLRWEGGTRDHEVRHRHGRHGQLRNDQGEHHEQYGAGKLLFDLFLSFKFPKPEGGGVVIVSYPFVSSPS